MRLLTVTALTTLATTFQLSTAGTWNDGVGDIADDWVSIFLYDPKYVDPGWHDYYSITIQDANHTGNDGVYIQSGCNGPYWDSYPSFLPYTVDVYKGWNFCDSTSQSD